MGHYLLKDAPKTGTGDLLISVQAVEPIRIPECNTSINDFETLLKKQIENPSKDADRTINARVYDAYNLSQEERDYLDAFFS